MKQELFDKIINSIKQAYEGVEELDPPSRESSVVKTKLDEARMWFYEWMVKFNPDGSN